MPGPFVMLFVRVQTALADWITQGTFSEWRRMYYDECARHMETAHELRKLRESLNKSTDT